MGHDARQQRAAPDHPDDHADQQLEQVAVEQPAREQIGGVAEHDAAGADRDRVRPAAISHVPRPPTTITIAVTSASRRRPRSAMITPMNTNGIVLSTRCGEKLACRNGEVKIAHRWPMLRA